MKLDAYEKELLQLDDDGQISVQSPDPKEKEALIAAARETLQKDKRINIRMSGRDLLSLKRKANRFGMPYQTLISSILHQYVSGDLKPSQVVETQSKYRKKNRGKDWETQTASWFGWLNKIRLIQFKKYFLVRQ